MNTIPPSIGRIVLFTPSAGLFSNDRVPAIIHRVYDDYTRSRQDMVDLTLFTSQGVQYRQGIPWKGFTTIRECGNTWDWPIPVQPRKSVEGTEERLTIEESVTDEDEADAVGAVEPSSNPTPDKTSEKRPASSQKEG